MKILLVDDNRSILSGLITLLKIRMKNHCFLSAENGQEAIGIIRSHRVDLVITDLNMPVMDGYELVAHMSEERSGVPVIAMTAEADTARAGQRLRPFGVAACLQKPFDVRELIRVISELVPQQGEAGLLVGA